MMINNKNLLGLPVMTKAGDYLGVVVGFDLDTDNGQIVRYAVSNKSLLNWFKVDSLLISRDQVLEITESKMIVSDLLIKETESERVETDSAVPVKNIEPVISNKME